MKITFRQLAVFDAVARHENVSLAAQEIHLSQSATSLALQDLERTLGVALFHRNKKRLALNENGRRLQPQVRNVLKLGREIEGADAGPGAIGVIHAAATSTIANYLLPPVCEAFLAANPNVRLKLSVIPEPVIIDQVENLAIDIGFIEGVSMRHTLAVEPWVRDELVVVASPRHRAAGKRVSMKSLARERWYLQPIGATARHVFLQPYSGLFDTDSIVFETNSIEAIKAAVADGNGLSCLSKVSVVADIAAGRLVHLPVTGFHLKRTFNIIYRKDLYHGTPHQRFLEQARHPECTTGTNS